MCACCYRDIISLSRQDPEALQRSLDQASSGMNHHEQSNHSDHGPRFLPASHHPQGNGIGMVRVASCLSDNIDCTGHSDTRQRPEVKSHHDRVDNGPMHDSMQQPNMHQHQQRELVGEDDQDEEPELHDSCQQTGNDVGQPGSADGQAPMHGRAPVPKPAHSAPGVVCVSVQTKGGTDASSQPSSHPNSSGSPRGVGAHSVAGNKALITARALQRGAAQRRARPADTCPAAVSHATAERQWMHNKLLQAALSYEHTLSGLPRSLSGLQQDQQQQQLQCDASEAAADGAADGVQRISGGTMRLLHGSFRIQGNPWRGLHALHALHHLYMKLVHGDCSVHCCATGHYVCL